MNITTIIVALIGGAGGILAGVLAIVKYFNERKDTKEHRTIDMILEQHLSPLRQELEALKVQNDIQQEELKEIRLDTTRTQLYIKMEHEPHNHDTILKIANRYFHDLQGDWVVTADFLAWAEKENVKIPEPVLVAIAENDKK